MRVKENSSSAIVIDENDNVGLAIKNLKAGENVTLITGENKRALTLKDDILFMHKFAITAIKAGDKITKYGQAVGTATQDITVGEHVDADNSKSLRGQFTKKRVPRKTE
jgi:predicted RecA/RadA family phage recombinase